jgi:hypothetical protein
MSGYPRSQGKYSQSGVSQQQFANVNTTLLFDTLMILMPGNPYLRERLSTLDLLVVTSLDNLLLILKTFFYFFTKQATLLRRSTVLRLPLQSVFPASALTFVIEEGVNVINILRL